MELDKTAKSDFIQTVVMLFVLLILFIIDSFFGYFASKPKLLGYESEFSHKWWLNKGGALEII